MTTHTEHRPAASTWPGWLALILSVLTILWHLFVSGHQNRAGFEKAELVSRFASVDSEVKSFAAKQLESGAALTALGDRLDKLGARLQSIEAGNFPALKKLDESVTRLRGAEGAAIASMQPLNESLSTLGGKVDAIGGQVTALGTQVSTLGKRVDAVDAALAKVGDSAAERGAVNTYRTDAAQLAAALARLESRLGALELKLGAQKATPTVGAMESEIGKAVAPLGARIDAIESAQGKAAAAVAGASLALAALDKRVDGAESMVRDRTAALAEANRAEIGSALAPLGKRLAAIEARLSPADAARDALSASVGQLQSQYGALAARPLHDAAELGRIYFGFGRWDLRASELEKLAAIVARPDGKTRPYALVGFTDRAGSDDYNQLLSTRRVAAVRRALIALGVDGARIATANGLGEMGTPVETPDEVPKQENRVVFVFGGR
ncbi:MAG: OmpA family protein [Burkholderiaceae bacterium]|nr:OmpA family protein [Burkholderiaceae bacterium]